MKKYLLSIILLCFIFVSPLTLTYAQVSIQVPEYTHTIVDPFERNFRFMVKLRNTGTKKEIISFGNDSKTTANKNDWIIIFPSGRIYLEPGEEQDIIAILEPNSNTKLKDEITYDYIFQIGPEKKVIPLIIKSQRLDFGQLKKSPIQLLVIDKQTNRSIAGLTYYSTIASGLNGFHDELTSGKGFRIEGVDDSVINEYYTKNKVQLSFSGNFIRFEKKGYRPLYISDRKTVESTKSLQMEIQKNFFEFKETAKAKTEFSTWWIKSSADNRLFVTSPGIHAAPGENKIPDEVGIYMFNDKGQQLWKFPISTKGYDGSDLCWGLDISPDGKYVAAGCYNGNIYLLNQQGNLVKTYVGGNMVDVVAFSPDNKYLAFGPADNGRDIGLVDLQTYNYFWTDTIGDRARTISFSPDGKLVAVATPNGLLTMYDINGKKLWRHSNGGLTTFLSNFSGDGGIFYIGGKGREIIGYDPTSGSIKWSKIIDQTPWASANNTSYNGSLAFGTVGGQIWYFDNQGNPLWRYEYGNFGHNADYLTQNGQYLLMGGGDPTLFDNKGSILWELYPGTDREKLIRMRKEDYIGAESAWISEDGKKMVLGFSDGTISFLEGHETQTSQSILHKTNIPIPNIYKYSIVFGLFLIIFLLIIFIVRKQQEREHLP